MTRFPTKVLDAILPTDPVLRASYAPTSLVKAATVAELPSHNELASRTVQNIQGWLGWLAANGAKGSITEFGYRQDKADALQHWERIAETWYGVLDAEDVPVLQWGDNGWFAPLATTPAAPRTFSVVNESAMPTLRHSRLAPRGFTLGGVVGVAPPAGFSNQNPATGANWYPDAASYAFLASLGMQLVRVPFRWEAIQPTLSGALNATEVARVQGAVSAAKAAGLKVVLDLHNYATYMTGPAGAVVPWHLGDGNLTSDHLANVWTRLSTVFRTESAVYAYELMNEPASMPAGGYASPAKAWEAASQQVVTALRTAGDTTLLLVPGYDYSSAARWTTNHPTGWITDPAGNFRYNAHNYWSTSATSDADYNITWAQEVANCAFPGGGGYVPLSGLTPGTGLPVYLQAPQVGEYTVRGPGLATTSALPTGLLNLTFFQARKSETINTVRSRILTAASVDPTLARFGVYRVNADYSLTLLASTANDVASVRTGFTTIAKTLTSPFYKRAGVWYAVGVLVVMPSGTGPVVSGMGGNAFDVDVWPFTNMSLFGQTDLPASIARNAITSGNAQYLAHGLIP